MAIVSRGYLPAPVVAEPDNNWPLFCYNLDLILNHKAHILNCSNYFFITLPDWFCSYAYATGDGQLFLGYLLKGWEENILTGSCTKCQDKVLVTRLSGSILSGSNKFTGICRSCLSEQSGHWETFGPHWQFVSGLRKKYPDKISEWQEYDGFEFSFGGNGLKPARKKKLVWKQLAEPVTLETLVNELKSGNIRQSKPANVSLLKQDCQLKLSGNQLNSNSLFSLKNQ